MVPLLLDFGPNGPSTAQWATIGVMGVISLYFVVIRPAMKKKKDPLAKPPAFASLAQQRNVERQMQNLLVELSEMTRQITAQLDTRTQKLQMLIEDADQRIAQLQQQNRLPMAAVTEMFAAPQRPELEQPVSFKSTTSVDSQHQQVYTLADQGRSAPEIARELNRPRGEVDLILALRAHV